MSRIEWKLLTLFCVVCLGATGVVIFDSWIEYFTHEAIWGVPITCSGVELRAYELRAMSYCTLEWLIICLATTTGLSITWSRIR